MTPKEKELRDFISDFWEEYGYAPSYQEMADGLGLKSKSGVDRLVRGLQVTGFISYRLGKNRSIRITKPPEEVFWDFLDKEGLTEKYLRWSGA